MSALINLIIVALVIGLVLMLAVWAINYLGVPEPFAKIAVVAIVVIGCLIFILQAMPLMHFAG